MKAEARKGDDQTWIVWSWHGEERKLSGLRFSSPQKVLRIYVGNMLIAAHPTCAQGAPDNFPLLPDRCAEWIAQNPPVLTDGLHVQVELARSRECVMTVEHHPNDRSSK